MLPAYLSAVSFVLLFAQAVKAAFFSKSPSSAGDTRIFRSHIQELGLRLFLFRTARLATCIALVVLWTLAPPQNSSVSIWVQAGYVRHSIFSVLT